MEATLHRGEKSMSCYSLLSDCLEQDISCAVMHALYYMILNLTSNYQNKDVVYSIIIL